LGAAQCSGNSTHRRMKVGAQVRWHLSNSQAPLGRCVQSSYIISAIRVSLIDGSVIRSNARRTFFAPTRTHNRRKFRRGHRALGTRHSPLESGNKVDIKCQENPLACRAHRTLSWMSLPQNRTFGVWINI
jgi:hypothetical protein